MAPNQLPLLWDEQPMAIAEPEARNAAPYVSFKTLSSFIEEMREHGLPDQIDRSVMRKLSGNNQTQLILALKFLRLVTDAGEVTDGMRTLAIGATTEPDFKAALSKILDNAYAEIIGTVNVESASYKQVADRFRDAGKVDGETLQKAIRFYLKAIEYVGRSYSRHLSAPQPRPASAKKNGSTKEKTKPAATEAKETGSPKNTREEEEDDRDDARDGMMRIPLYLPGKPLGSITIPEDLDDDDCNMIDGMLRAIATRRSAAK